MRAVFPNTGDSLGIINHTFYGPKTAINDRTAVGGTKEQEKSQLNLEG